MNNHETAVALAKTSPPVAVSTAAVFGLPLPDLVLILTAIYTTLQIVFLVRDKWKARQEKKRVEHDRATDTDTNE